MVLESRVQDIEGEVNLLKAEVKATLVDIREHLLNTDIKAVLSTDKSPSVIQSSPIDNNGRSRKGDGMNWKQTSVPRPSLAEEDIVKEDEENGYFEGSASVQCLSNEKQRHQVALDTVDPNLMASLLRWVVLTRKHIRHEDLEAFMEICDLSGGLQGGVRQLVCRIAEIIHDDATTDETSYAKWSDLMLQLHGIISSACFFSKSSSDSTQA